VDMIAKRLMLFSAVMVCFLTALPLFSADIGVETKISIETNLENRLKKILQEITGTDQMVVMINVELYSEQKQQQPAAQKKQEMLLPGVPVKESAAEKKIAELLTPITLGEQKALIKKMTATIILDQSTDKEVEELVKQVATGILGIDAVRGDQLSIRKIQFKKGNFSWNSMFFPPFVFGTAGIALGVLFFFVVTIFFLLPFKGGFTEVARALESVSKSGSTSGEGSAASAVGNAGLAMLTASAGVSSGMGGEAKSGEGDGSYKPFRFVNSNNIASLVYVLKDAPAENVALVANYIQPDLIPEYLASFPDDVQSKVVGLLSKVNLWDIDTIKKSEEHLRNLMDGMVGGEQKIVSMVNYVDDDAREKIISAVNSQNPGLAAKVQAQVVTLESLSKYTQESMLAIYRSVNPSIFALVLKTAPAGVADKVIAALPPAAAERLKQEIEMGAQLPKGRLAEEKRRILQIIKKLEQDGVIKKA